MSTLKDYFEYEKRNLFADELSQRESFSNVLNILDIKTNDQVKNTTPIKSPFFALGFSFVGLSFAALVLFVNVGVKESAVVSDQAPVLMMAKTSVNEDIETASDSSNLTNASKKAQTKAKISDTINLIASIQSFE